MTIRAGTSFAGWRIDGEVGRGGMGIVYRAYDPALNRMVALKLIRTELSADVLFRMRFDRERKAQASLDHPHIVEIYSSGESDGSLYVAMKLIDGPSLADLLAHGSLPPAEVLRILSPIGDALDHAHSRGPIHRDLKPQNILLDSESRPFLTDFGLAWIPGHSRMTTTGAFMGTTAYASPEQLRGQSVGPASDVYSLACVLFECLSGEVPFPRDSADVTAHAPGGNPILTAANPLLPEAIDDVVRKGMAPVPADRHASAAALIEDVAAALGVSGLSPAKSAEREHADRTPSGPTSRSAIFAILLPVIVLGLLLGHRARGEESTPRLTRSARGAAVSLKHPAGWRRSAKGEPIAGLRFEQPLHLKSLDGSARLTTGMVRAAGELLLPRALLEKLPAPPQQEQVISLAAGSAYRYPDLRVGKTRFDLYAVPTTAGVATVACSFSPGGERDLCGRIATTLRLRRARSYMLGPSPGYGRVLDRVLAELGNRRRTDYRRLNASKTSTGQAAAAANVRRAFTGAAHRLARVRITPQSADGNAHVVRALERVAEAYGELVTSIQRGDADAYDAAASAVAEREADVQEALHRLRKLGYQVS